MEVRELYNFCIWFVDYGTTAINHYKALQKKLQHNATQAQKEPVKEELKQLLQTLRSIPMHELTAEQLSLLHAEEVDGFLGTIGAQHVENIVKSARFDAASANEDVQAIGNALRASTQRMQAIKDGISSVSFFQEESEEDFDCITVRVHFKENAAISDVVEWKKWSEEWLDIIRGIALSVDEAPENVKVLGAHQGSVIMVLGATAAVTSLLLLISTHLTKIALNGLQVANAVEDLKHKTKLNKTITDGLQKSIEQTEKDGLKTLLEEAKKSLPSPINGEQENALKKSIEKYQKFTNKGGEVDFISPPEPEENEEDEDLNEAKVEQINSVRDNIEELRNTREETRLLTNQSDEETDFEDEDLKDEDEGEENSTA